MVTQGPPGNLYARLGHVGLFLSFLFSKDFVTKVLADRHPRSSHQVLSSVPAQLQTGIRSGWFLKGEACPPGQEAEWTLALGA